MKRWTNCNSEKTQRLMHVNIITLLSNFDLPPPKFRLLDVLDTEVTAALGVLLLLVPR